MKIQPTQLIKKKLKNVKKKINTLTRIECDKNIVINVINKEKENWKNKKLLSYDFFNCV